MDSFLKKYGKTIVAVIAGIVLALQAGITDGEIAAQEWLTVAVAGLTAAGVFYAPAITKTKAKNGS
jgi:hypothetical protein